MPAYLLDGFLKGSSTKVQTIAIGSHVESYYCQNTVGQVIYDNIPKGLDDAITGRQKILAECVNLGRNDEWFVRFADGKWSSNGMSNSCRDAIDTLQNKGSKIHEILFGHGYSSIVRYHP